MKQKVGKALLAGDRLDRQARWRPLLEGPLRERWVPEDLLVDDAHVGFWRFKLEVNPVG